jgi:hypothetical protein
VGSGPTSQIPSLKKGSFYLGFFLIDLAFATFS